ncbi:MAG: efflux RND transporter periplasmic adaptor subunit [Deferribacterales bacterium]
MKIKIAAVIAVLLILGAGFYFYKGKGGSTAAPAQAGQRPPVEVEVFTVSQGDITFTKELSGRTSAYQIAEIRPQVSGIIIKRFFTEGSRVQSGQQLYQIDPAPYQAAYESAVASLQSAEANLTSAEPRAKRYSELVDAGGVSRQEYDDAVSALAQAKAAVAQAKAAITTAKINLDYTKVFAPISGRIGKSSVTEGALVTANQATALATVQNLDKIYVDVNQSAADIINLKKMLKSENGSHTEATLTLEGSSEAYGHNGAVQFSDVTVDETTGTVQLRILFPNPEGELLPGLFVKANVAQYSQSGAITVPQQAVSRNADGSVTVWAVDASNVVNVRPIKVSKVLGDKWLVTEGLAAGDRVVTAGLQKIAPGAAVSPVEPAKKAE